MRSFGCFSCDCGHQQIDAGKQEGRLQPLPPDNSRAHQPPGSRRAVWRCRGARPFPFPASAVGDAGWRVTGRWPPDGRVENQPRVMQ